ncbi:type ISP restriction/modification enzyme [Geodermatophilus sp. CPCC 206100]|uniref:type ISP restriction/modification enzyme n=1 Tax=Geodermatophilus sp. CPCC 206100 TaxID=3020054 RepID=UPI003B00F16A
MALGKPTAEQKAEGARSDRSVIHYDERITLRDVPLEAYRHTLGSRSAIEWIIDRYWVKTDKASGIVNNLNDWSFEVDSPRYILDLLARVVAVSLETMEIVDALPGLISVARPNELARRRVDWIVGECAPSHQSDYCPPRCWALHQRHRLGRDGCRLGKAVRCAGERATP